MHTTTFRISCGADEQKFPLPKNVVTPVGEAGGGYATQAVQFADDLFAEKSLKFVDDNRDRPFFLYWSLVIPHANNERTSCPARWRGSPRLWSLCGSGLAQS